MKKGINPRSAVKVKSIAEYVCNKSIRQNIFTVITPKEIKHYYQGQEIDRKDFNKCFPLVLIPVNYKGENKDGTKIK